MYKLARWVELNKSIWRFRDEILKLVEELRYVPSWRDSFPLTRANCMLCTILTCAFIITVYSFNCIIDRTLALSRLLQTETSYIFSAKEKYLEPSSYC